MRKYILFTVSSAICLVLSVAMLVIFVEIYAVPHLLTSEFKQSTCAVVGFIYISPANMDINTLNNSIIENLMIGCSTKNNTEGTTEFNVENIRHLYDDTKAQNLENEEGFMDTPNPYLNDDSEGPFTRSGNIFQTVKDFNNYQNSRPNHGCKICEYEDIHSCDNSLCTTTPIVRSEVLSSTQAVKDKHLKVLVKDSRTYYSFITSALSQQVKFNF